MTALAIGSSATVSLRDAGQVTVSTNGGFASVTVTPTASVAQTVGIGPGPTRRTFGPYTEGATVVMVNSSVGEMDYDRPGGNVATFSADGRSLVDGVGNRFSLVPPKSTAVGRLAGGSLPSTNASANTRTLKKESEAPFDAVRLHIWSREVTASTGFKAVVAATESAARSTTAQQARPYVGGTGYTALRSAVGQPGWAAVTFGGSASGNCTAAVNNGGSASTSYQPGYLSSDWIELPSVTRADGVGRNFPLAMCRIYKDGTVNALSIMGNLTADTNADLTGWQTEAAKPWYRLFEANTMIGADAVGTLTTEPASATPSNVFTWADLEFAYRTRALSVLGVGDSLTEASAFSFGGFGNWGQRGCALASSEALPIAWINGGISGQPSSIFIPTAEAMITALSPTHILYELLSPNDDPGGVAVLSAVTIAVSMSRLQRMHRAARAAGTRLVVWAGLPNNGYDAAGDAFRLTLKAQAISFCTATGSDFIDFESVAGTGAAPNRMVSSYDATHPNNALMDIMAEKLRTYLLTQ
jgi:hypothetical protein